MVPPPPPVVGGSVEAVVHPASVIPLTPSEVNFRVVRSHVRVVTGL